MSDVTNPYSLVFRDSGVAEEYFPRISRELPRAGGNRDRDLFFSAPSVSDLMQAIAPESGVGAAQVGLLAYHAYHHWRTGARSWGMLEAELRALLTGPPLGRWHLAAPAEAGYFTLPRHRVWVAADPASPAEPADGFFWVLPEAGGAGTQPVGPEAGGAGTDSAERAGQGREVALAGDFGPELLLVLGMRGGSEGISVVELSSVPLPPEGHWGDVDARGDGRDFAAVLPGGEHLLGLATAGEVLKLASRVFWQLVEHGSVRDRAGA